MQPSGSSLGQSFSRSADLQFSSTSVSPPIVCSFTKLLGEAKIPDPCCLSACLSPFWAVPLGSLLWKFGACLSSNSSAQEAIPLLPPGSRWIAYIPHQSAEIGVTKLSTGGQCPNISNWREILGHKILCCGFRLGPGKLQVLSPNGYERRLRAIRTHVRHCGALLLISTLSSVGCQNKHNNNKPTPILVKYITVLIWKISGLSWLKEWY